MASGCLCIGTDVPGINEIIEHNVNGILSKSTSSKDISKAIKLAMKIKEKEILIKRGISKIKHNFSLTQITNKEFLILKDLVDGK
jgi:glycosyltransferase involved in cell wall biosynthesis